MTEELPELKPYSQRGYGTITVNGVTTPIVPESGYEFVPEGATIKRGYKPYDYYSGWLQSGYGSYHVKNGFIARSEGRWLAWERRIRKRRG